ncbi:MAG TPA: hypothetical protein VKA57_00020, partial [Solirubrobacteraceae bacterium]|nr:hypothetical protein [Solirubrobacteraceae bacterium]
MPGSPSSAIPMMATAAVPGAGRDRVRRGDGDVLQREREQVEADAVPIVSDDGGGRVKPSESRSETVAPTSVTRPALKGGSEVLRQHEWRVE